MPSPNYLLQSARFAKGLSLRKLARELGVSLKTIHRWEQGLQEPYPIHKEKLCLFFAKTPSELGFDEPADLSRTSKQRGALRFQSSLPEVRTAEVLVGRENDLALVRQQVLTGHTALLGLPGVGKTTLALEIASDAYVRAHFFDGILWAGLGQTPNMDELFRSWCHLILDFSPQKLARLTREKIIVALRAAIGDQHILLLLDDVWASDDARMLLQVAGPNCGVLITTRSPLIGTEVVGQNTYLLSELDEEAGLQLLGLLAPQAIQREPERARELVKAVGGLPLALSLMGRSLASEAWSGHARRVARAIEHVFDANVRLNMGEYSL
ncbi:MAG: NB-ARC domain-containing protein, partial [Ktedonobacteraceae bacterium]